jgi:hypothetical protein
VEKKEVTTKEREKKKERERKREDEKNIQAVDFSTCVYTQLPSFCVYSQIKEREREKERKREREKERNRQNGFTVQGPLSSFSRERHASDVQHQKNAEEDAATFITRSHRWSCFGTPTKP